MTTEMHSDCDACTKPDELTHDRVEQALVEAEGSITDAARILSRHRTTVHRFIREHGITVKRQVVIDA